MSKKIILVTGGTAGIGKHTALHLHARGHRVIATGRNPKALAELRAEGLDTIALDVTSTESIRAAKIEIDRITSGHGIDVLVNNAGYGLFGPVELLSDEDVRAQFDTNVFGLLAVTRAFVPEMRARGAGRVINVSSVGGRMVFPLGGVYHATKYAVEALSHALRMELRQFGIRVSVVEPGYIKTEFTSTTIGLLQKYAAADSPYAHSLAGAAQADKAIERFAVGPHSVARAIEHAAVARWSRPRYVAPFYNALGPLMIDLLPRWLTDWAFRRIANLRLPAGAAPARLPVAA
ncbi:MAG: SDR family oxidoreductase [Myxococcota bacterium]|nr:SDR family oxidoreductase [Myxococcota bacterium]